MNKSEPMAITDKALIVVLFLVLWVRPVWLYIADL